jgi:RimJ/RimL family protein N-acetyltransferase
MATEALESLVNWVFQHSFSKAIIAHTLIDASNSQRVLERAGFERISEENGLILWRKMKSN